MTLTLHLPPQTERKLQELAAQSGLDLADYTLSVIRSHVEAQVGTAADGDDHLLAEALARMTGRTPEQIEEARARASDFIRPGKALPAGETVLDVVAGSWPSDESDEEVAEALRKLS